MTTKKQRIQSLERRVSWLTNELLNAETAIRALDNRVGALENPFPTATSPEFICKDLKQRVQVLEQWAFTPSPHDFSIKPEWEPHPQSVPNTEQ